MQPVTMVKGITKFSIQKYILERQNWVKYLVVPDWQVKIYGELIVTGDPGKEFKAAVDVHVNAYLFNKKEPPAEIATAIMNIADDVLNGRDVILKTGDYISIQNFVRGRR
jgi:hypothetical protein